MVWGWHCFGASVRAVGCPGHYLLALNVPNMLVTEVNTATRGRTLTAVSNDCWVGGLVHQGAEV
jgi:hypothetical protein